jgi:hypothetical protein
VPVLSEELQSPPTASKRSAFGAVRHYFANLCELSASPVPWDRTTYLALLGLAVLWGVRLYTTWETWGSLSIDSGHEMYVPAVLAEGKMLYRDVWYMHGPLAPYFNSWLFRIFGIHLNVLYWAGSLAALGSAVFLFLAGKRLGSRLAGWTAGGVVIIQAFHAWHFCFPLPYGFASVYGCLVACAFVWMAVNAALSERSLWVFGAGMAAAIALLLKLEFGAACYAALFPLITLKAWRKRSWRSLLLHVAWCLPGALLCSLVIGWMLSLGGFQFITEENIVSFPTTSFMRIYGKMWLERNGLSFSPHDFFEALLRSLFFAGAVFEAWSFLWWKRRDAKSYVLRGVILAALTAFALYRHWKPLSVLGALFFPRDMILFVCIAALFAGIYFLHEKHSPQSLALLILFAFAGLLASRLLLRNVPAGYPIYYNGPAALAYMLLLRPIIPRAGFSARTITRNELLICLGCLTVVAVYSIQMLADPTDLVRLTTDRGSIRVPKQVARNYEAAIRFMKEKAARGEMVLSVPEDTSLYFLSGTHCPTRVFQLSPGIIPPGKMTEETIQQIDQQPVQYLIWSNRTYPDYGTPVFGKDYDQEIGNYLTSHYQSVGLLVPDSYLDWETMFTLWERKTSGVKIHGRQ